MLSKGLRTILIAVWVIGLLILLISVMFAFILDAVGAGE
jgi:hypothetical protein